MDEQEKHTPEEQLKHELEKYTRITHQIDPSLDIKANPGIYAAATLVNHLMQAVEKSETYKDLSTNDPLVKFMHSGWAEHNWLKRAFESAHRILSRVEPAMTTKGIKNYRVEIIFYDNQDQELATFDTYYSEDGKISGGIGFGQTPLLLQQK